VVPKIGGNENGHFETTTGLYWIRKCSNDVVREVFKVTSITEN
jgi:hypothetical protein